MSCIFEKRRYDTKTLPNLKQQSSTSRHFPSVKKQRVVLLCISRHVTRKALAILEHRTDELLDILLFSTASIRPYQGMIHAFNDINRQKALA